jgi:hypothetical protein
MKMKTNSKTFVLGALAGMVVSFIIYVIFDVLCLAPILGITVACYVAKVVTPKDGAITGAIVPIPLWIYFIFQIAETSLYLNPDAVYMIGSFLIILVSMLGSFYGLIMGGIFRSTRGNDIAF